VAEADVIVVEELWMILDEIKPFEEDLFKLVGLTRTAVEVELELRLVVGVVLGNTDEDVTTELPVIFLLLLLLLPLIFLVLLTNFVELIVFCKLDVEDLELDVGLEVEPEYLLEDDIVDLRLEGNVGDDFLLDDMMIMLDDEVIFLVLDGFAPVVIPLVDEILMIVFEDEGVLMEVFFTLEEEGFPSTQLQSAMRL
jgi:uncharacterized membrane protein YhdT